MKLDEQIQLVKVMLSKMAGKEVHWTEFMKLTLQECGTPATFHRLLSFMLRQGYIVRKERGVYEITEKGRNLMKALSS